MIKYEKIFGNLLIVDASYLLHRVLHNNAVFELRGPDGQRSGGVFSFIRTLNKEIRNNPGYFPVLCFDGGLSPRRVSVDPFYKNAPDRNNTPEVMTQEELDSDYLTQFRKQRSMTMELLSYAGIPSLRFNSVLPEGDDIMYILSKSCNKGLVLTDDRDMLQLVTDTVTVRRPMADEYITNNSLIESNGYDEVYDFVMNKAIIGDGSDNIPGCCKGIGGGTSGQLIKLMKLVDEYSDINPENEDMLRKLCADNGIKFRKAMINFNSDRYDKNIQLVDLNLVDTDVTQNIIDSIYSEVSNCRSNTDFFKLSAKLSMLGIKEIYPDQLISMVKDRYKYMRAGDIQ